jgi:hypothetical protein
MRRSGEVLETSNPKTLHLRSNSAEAPQSLADGLVHLQVDHKVDHKTDSALLPVEHFE